MNLNPGSGGVVLGRIVLVCGAITAGAGALILVGWAIGSDALTAIGTGYIPMAPNTALLFALLGNAVQFDKHKRRRTDLSSNRT